MYYRHIKVVPTGAACGAAVRGLDLTQPLKPEVLAEIRFAWLQHLVVFFPDQPMSIEDLERFTQALGPFGSDPYIKPMADHPHVLEIRREPDEEASAFGAAWHSDWSFQATPPSATLLLGKIVPPVGGDTLFANAYAAYDDLSETMKAVLAPLKGVHSAALPYSKEGFYANEGKKRSITVLPSDEAKKTVAHPLVRTHGETGRRVLFVNPVYTVGIEGMAPKEANAILGFLYQHMTQPKYVYRHSWAPEMLTMWDNRCCLHNATGGYDGHRRVMHRTTVAGEAPLAAA